MQGISIVVQTNLTLITLQETMMFLDKNFNGLKITPLTNMK